jgi:opine dehydrogenase
MMIKSIAVLGAGHGGCAAAADLGQKGFSVRLHARTEERLATMRKQGGIRVSGIHEGLVPIDLMTTDVSEAVKGADLIMLVVPSVAHQHYARSLASVLAPNQPIFLDPGHTGGGLNFVYELREAGYTGPVETCETVTLTYISRLLADGHVHIYRYTTNLAFAAFPGRSQMKLFALIKSVFPNIREASSVIETALTNINAVFHPTGMLMNAGWIEHTNGNFLFYIEGITESVGRVTEAVDRERLAVAKALKIPAISFLDAFHRAGLTTEAARASGSISRACHESEANKAIKSPPSLRHRYIMEDVGYGIVPISAFASLAGVKTPTIDALITLASEAVGIDLRATGLNLKSMGLADLPPSELGHFIETGTRREVST